MRRDVTDHLQLLLRKAGHYLHTSAEKEVVRTIKEKTCYLAMNPVKEEKDNGGAWEEFRLPDGKVIQVCLFFQASAVASSLSRHHLLCIPRTPKLISARRREIFSPRDNVQSRIDRTRIPRCSSSHCRLDQQGRFRFEEIAVWKYRLIGRINTVYRSVITLLCCLYHWKPGFGDRLLNEVKKLAIKDVKLKIYAPPERKVYSFNYRKTPC